MVETLCQYVTVNARYALLSKKNERKNHINEERYSGRFSIMLQVR